MIIAAGGAAGDQTGGDPAGIDNWRGAAPAQDTTPSKHEEMIKNGDPLKPAKKRGSPTE